MWTLMILGCGLLAGIVVVRAIMRLRARTVVDQQNDGFVSWRRYRLNRHVMSRDVQYVELGPLGTHGTLINSRDRVPRDLHGNVLN